MDLSEGRNIEAVAEQPKKLVFFSKEGLPAMAGEATLRFVEDGQSHTRAVQRSGNLITFPVRAGELVFHPLRGGTQFLTSADGHYWFGGTDDDKSVFLSEVTQVAYRAFLAGGEATFYESLKPGALRQLESEYPDGITHRQGDIFAFWCADFGKTVRGLMSALGARGFDDGAVNTSFCLERQERSFDVAGSRHILSGTCVTAAWSWLPESGKDKQQYSEVYYLGELQAPDHPSLKLDRPYQLFRAVNIIWPQKGGD